MREPAFASGYGAAAAPEDKGDTEDGGQTPEGGGRRSEARGRRLVSGIWRLASGCRHPVMRVVRAPHETIAKGHQPCFNRGDDRTRYSYLSLNTSYPPIS